MPDTSDMPDMRLVKKGRNEPLDGLLQEGRAHAELGGSHAGPLTLNGWPADDTTNVRTIVTQLDTKAAAKADAHEASLGLTSAQEVAIDRAKAFMRKLRNALPRALRENPTLGVSASAFAAGDTLGRSVPKISRYLGNIRPSVVKLDAPLTGFFGGTAPSTLLDAVKTELDTSDATQEAALAALPLETQKVYELKGRLLELIEDMNRAGRSAYDGDATTASIFNKDILLRARKAREKATDASGDTKKTT